MRRLACLALLAFAPAAGAAPAAHAPLPGVVTPSGNISCFYVPVGRLHCEIRQSAFGARLQRACIARAALDWHGFTLPASRPAVSDCTGGILYLGTPRLRRLAYGSTWRFGAFTCVSRSTGLTCTSRYGHGIFLSRQAWHGW